MPNPPLASVPRASIQIVSWNINSVRFRPALIDRLLQQDSPDILCLQETKAEDSLFPAQWFAERGYVHQCLNGQRMHHGVAIVSRLPLTEATRHDWQDNGEARHIGVRLPNGLRLENVYVPAGGDVPDREVNPKFGQKLDFLERMTRWSTELSEGTVLVGDFNIAPLPCDVWSHKTLLNVVSHTPIEVDALDRLQASAGWVDIARRFVPPPARLYSWWSYRARDWAASDRGRRLDHIWMTPDVADRATTFRVLESCRGWESPSDHVPLLVEITV